jgi:hypothetical protein
MHLLRRLLNQAKEQDLINVLQAVDSFVKEMAPYVAEHEARRNDGGLGDSAQLRYEVAEGGDRPGAVDREEPLREEHASETSNREILQEVLDEYETTIAM